MIQKSHHLAVPLCLLVSWVMPELVLGQVTLDPSWPENPRTIGGSQRDEAYDVQQTSDGGYIVVGWTNSSGSGSVDAYIVKLDPEGRLDAAWEANPRAIGGPGSDYAYSVQQTQDGGYIVAGDTDSAGSGVFDVYVVKLDPQGNLDSAWNTNPRTFGGSNSEFARSVRQTNDGGYIVGGMTLSFGAGSYDAYLIKLDASGNLDPAWDPNPKTFGGSQADQALCVQQTSDNGYIVVGKTRSFGARLSDVLLIKLTPSGKLDAQWNSNPVAIGEWLYDDGTYVQQTSDNGYVVAGFTVSRPGSFTEDHLDAYVFKLTAQGQLDPTWEINPKALGSRRMDQAYSVHETQDGGYIIGGTTLGIDAYDEAVYMIKLDPQGNLDPVWNVNPRSYGDAPHRSYHAECVRPTRDGGFISAGWSQGPASLKSDCFLLKLAPARRFRRGDFDGDGRVVAVPDAIFSIRYLYLDGPRPPCLAACDANGDGHVTTTTDALYLLSHFFLGTQAPPPPYSTCGPGQLWTDGPLTCEVEPECP